MKRDSEPRSDDMKLRVARTLKWNVVDKVSTQVLYAVTGIILARLLSQADFGLVGALLVFQAFASLFVDSGFSYALIQRKAPTQEDYSTVLWFNVGMAVAIYLLLWVGAPLIAWCYQGDERLIPLSRVMFLTFILNATAIVQTNRLMKRMEVKMIAVSNSLGLAVGALVGIWLAMTGYGAWAIVWQSVALSGTKSAVLWLTGGWRPSWRFSWPALKSFGRVGMGVMGSSALNTLFQNIYSFFIGNRVGMVALGYYTQADKWSKMGISSLSAILTSSFLPVLSQYQDDRERFASSTAKMNRSTAYLLFPAVGMLVVMATPIFHALFGEKWDASIALFQLLLLRGIFTVLSGLYTNYILSKGRSRLLVVSELLRDGVAVVAIVLTLPYISLSSPSDFTEGVRIFVVGQVVASAVAWVALLFIGARIAGRSAWEFCFDNIPYLAETLVVMLPMTLLAGIIENPWLLMAAQGLVGIGLYWLLNRMGGSKVQADMMAYIKGKL
ncbi:MAG: lipopolysaccharide biosynthesis protein [Bacteroidales bacterium]|nr:lipopolysaccharide biosynthesis protein [Bacteroidales bacterium]